MGKCWAEGTILALALLDPDWNSEDSCLSQKFPTKNLKIGAHIYIKFVAFSLNPSNDFADKNKKKERYDEDKTDVEVVSKNSENTIKSESSFLYFGKWDRNTVPINRISSPRIISATVTWPKLEVRFLVGYKKQRIKAKVGTVLSHVHQKKLILGFWSKYLISNKNSLILNTILKVTHSRVVALLISATVTKICFYIKCSQIVDGENFNMIFIKLVQ